MPVGSARTLESILARTVAGARFNATLVTLFGAIALGLAALGIYGVVAYSVSRRTAEIGVRLALGAHPATIYRMVLGQGLGLAGAGLLLGLAAALVLTRYLATLLFEVGTLDAPTLAATSALLLAALAACWVPAGRAAAVEPTTALRDE
jgi:putative ABC transport system permease protein